MFTDAHFAEAEQATAAIPAFIEWVLPRLDDGRAAAWLAEADGQTVGSSLAFIYQWHPGITELSTPMGYVMNVYVAPEHRRKGLARRLVCEATDWLKGRGLKRIRLHASDAGRPLYESLGFKPKPEMELIVDAED